MSRRVHETRHAGKTRIPEARAKQLRGLVAERGYHTTIALLATSPTTLEKAMHGLAMTQAAADRIEERIVELAGNAA